MQERSNAAFISQDDIPEGSGPVITGAVYGRQDRASSRFSSSPGALYSGVRRQVQYSVTRLRLRREGAPNSSLGADVLRMRRTPSNMESDSGMIKRVSSQTLDLSNRGLQPASWILWHCSVLWLHHSTYALEPHYFCTAHEHSGVRRDVTAADGTSPGRVQQQRLHLHRYSMLPGLTFTAHAWDRLVTC